MGKYHQKLALEICTYYSKHQISSSFCIDLTQTVKMYELFSPSGLASQVLLKSLLFLVHLSDFSRSDIVIKLLLN